MAFGNIFLMAQPPLLFQEGNPLTDRGDRDRNFDLHPDGQRFAVLKAPEGQSETKADKVVLILNFSEELRRLAPSVKR